MPAFKTAATVAGETHSTVPTQIVDDQGNAVGASNPLNIGHATATQVLDPLGVLQAAVQTGVDSVPQSGVPAGAQQLMQPFVPAPTIAANIAIGSQVVTPSAMTGTSRGAAWSIQVGSYLIIANSNGSNLEKVRVTAVAPTTFTATFAQTKTGPGITIVGEVLNQAKDSTIADGSSPAGVGSGMTFLWNGLLNAGVGGIEIMRSAAGENSGAQFGINLAAEYEETSGGPPLANGTPSLLRYDREVAGVGKVASGATVGAGYAISSTTAGDAILTPTVAANFKTLTPGQWVRLQGAGTNEYVRVADTYTISTAPATIPLTSPVVNTGQTIAIWDTNGADGPGQNPVLLTGEGFEGLLLNDKTKPGFYRVLQGNPAGEAMMTVGGLQTTAVAAAGSANIKTTPGRLARVLITVAGTASLTIYDNAAGNSTGTIIGITPATTSIGQVYDFQTPAAAGISAIGGAGSPGATVSWS